MGRPPCCDKSNVKKGSWTEEEDAKIIAHVSIHGTGNWSSVPKRAGLNRCAKSCRLRYTNYLRPDLKREGFTPEEEHMIVYLHATIGSRWSTIAQYLPGRTDNDVKNYWNTKLKKKLFQQGIDPITHKPISQILLSLGVVSPRTTTTKTSTDGGGGPRISCLNRDLKNVFMSRSESMVDPVVGLHEMGPTSGYDLLTQLQAIKLVTDVSNAATSTSSTLELPRHCSLRRSTPYLSPCTSSSSSNAAQPPRCSEELSWSDFLVDDVVLCIDGEGENGKNRMAYSDQVEKSKLVISNDSSAVGYGTLADDVDGASGDAFVESMLSCDGGHMDWDLPEFDAEDDALAGVVEY